MEERYIKAISDNPKWIRPAGWLQMPTITSADNKLAFLFAVYQNQENCFTINYGSGVCNYDIDWGDGSSITVVNSTTIQDKRYVYSAITSPILVDEYGDDYKQVIINVTFNSGTLAIFTINPVSASIGAAGNRTGRPQILESIISWDRTVNFVRSFFPLMQSLIIKKLIPTAAITSYFANMINLRNLEGIENIDTTSVASMGSLFVKIGNINKINVNFNQGTSAVTLFGSSLIREFGDITLTNTGTLSGFLSNCFDLVKVGDITTASTFLGGFFQGSSVLREVGTIDAPAATNIGTMFNTCAALESVIFTDCSNITTTTNAFGNCLNLRRVVVPGLKVSFSLNGCNLQRDEILETITSLGTAPGASQNITLTGNPGLSDLTIGEITAILTPKNWTYTP